VNEDFGDQILLSDAPRTQHDDCDH
jgi:hypothetical protein